MWHAQGLYSSTFLVPFYAPELLNLMKWMVDEITSAGTAMVSMLFSVLSFWINIFLLYRPREMDGNGNALESNSKERCSSKGINQGTPGLRSSERQIQSVPLVNSNRPGKWIAQMFYRNFTIFLTHLRKGNNRWLLKSQVRVALTNCNIRVHLHELCPQEFNWPRLQLWYCPIFLFPFTLQKARGYHAFSMFQFPNFLDTVFAAVRWLGRSIWAIKIGESGKIDATGSNPKPKPWRVF